MGAGNAGCLSAQAPRNDESVLAETQAEAARNDAGGSNDTTLAQIIDHTMLTPATTEKDIEQMCNEALQYNFHSVCCNPCWISKCKELLDGSEVSICCVVGFPLGANTTNIKKMEAIRAVKDGANELDMVMNIGKAKSGDWKFVRNDINTVVKAVAKEGVLVKVILETCLLTDDEVVRACQCAVNAKAKFVKTSTGFADGGATVPRVKLMRKAVDEEAVRLGLEPGSVSVKASGGIRTRRKSREMIEAGADRIGASDGIQIVKPNEAVETTVETLDIDRVHSNSVMQAGAPEEMEEVEVTEEMEDVAVTYTDDNFV